MFRPLSLALLLATPTFAETPEASLDGTLDGIWDITYEACANEVSDARITIAGSEMRFYESVCTLANRTPVPGMQNSWFFDVSCQGEGDTWAERVIIGLTFQGVELVYLSDTVGFQVSRCDAVGGGNP